MKQRNKKIALLLVAALLFSNASYVQNADASQVDTVNDSISAVSDGAITVTSTAIATLTPATTTGAVITTTPEATSDATSTPDATKTPEVTETPESTTGVAVTTTPTTTATATADATSTPDITTTPEVTQTPEATTGAAVTTAPSIATPTVVPTENPNTTTGPSITASPSIIHQVGETFTSGSYTYSVSKAPTDTTSGTVTLKNVVSTSLTKTSLTVESSVRIDGYSYKITEIGERAFKSCKKLKTITINNGVSVIKMGAFRGITTLTQVNLPTSLTYIQAYAFYGCTGLRKIEFPAKLNTIGKKAFYNCKKLKAIFVKGNSITSIKTQAFGNVKSGCYMVVPSGMKTFYANRVKASGAKKMIYYTY